MHNSIQLPTGFVTKDLLQKLHLEDLEEDDDEDDNAKNKNVQETVSIPKRLSNDEKRASTETELSTVELLVTICI